MKKNTQKKLTVTIGIPAHNEEQNIENMLKSLMRQQDRNYVLEQIYILCDGCTDSTAEIVKKISQKYSVISVLDDGRHIGKNSRLNQLFRASKSSVCIVFDADVVLAHPNVIDELVEPFTHKKTGLVGGNDRPCPPTNWFEKVAITFFEMWYEIRKDLNGGDSIHNIHGPIYALRKDVYKHVRLLTAVNADDHQVYFWTKKLGFQMAFAKKAVIFYRIPKTLKEYFVQHTRYLVGPKEFGAYYGRWVEELYVVPRSAKVNGILTVFLRKPHIVLTALGLQIALRIMRMTTFKNTSRGMWKTINTSKKAISL